MAGRQEGRRMQASTSPNPGAWGAPPGPSPSCLRWGPSLWPTRTPCCMLWATWALLWGTACGHTPCPPVRPPGLTQAVHQCSDLLASACRQPSGLPAHSSCISLHGSCRSGCTPAVARLPGSLSTGLLHLAGAPFASFVAAMARTGVLVSRHGPLLANAAFLPPGGPCSLLRQLPLPSMWACCAHHRSMSMTHQHPQTPHTPWSACSMPMTDLLLL